MKLLRSFIKNEKGLSLVELIVTVAIMGIVSVGIGTAIVTTTKSYSTGSSEVGLQQETQNITNILNNLVIDASFASNFVDDTGTLVIENTNNEFFLIKVTGDIANSNGVLTYQKIIPDNAENFKTYVSKVTTEPVGYTEAEGYVLSECVNKFKATPGVSSGSWDYTVSFDLGFNKKTAGTTSTRNMKTAFVAASRNGEAIKLYEENDLAVIVADEEAVIEPNQPLDPYANPFRIPFDILLSGDRSGVSFAVDFENQTGSSGARYCFSKVNESGISTTTYVNDGSTPVYNTFSDNITDTWIEVFAGADQKNSINATIYVSKSGVYSITKTIEIKVRRVNEVVNFDHPSISPSGGEAKAGTVYEFKPSLSVQNGDRFFALPSDDDYVLPYSSRIEFEKSYSGNIIITIKDKTGASSDIVYTNPSTFNIDYRYKYFTLSLSKNLEKGDYVKIRTIAEHAGFSSTDTGADNKTGKKYDYVYDEYTIEGPIDSPFPEEPNFQRGSQWNRYFTLSSDNFKTSSVVDTYLCNYFLSDSAVVSDFYTYWSSPAGASLRNRTVYDTSIPPYGANRPVTEDEAKAIWLREMSSYNSQYYSIRNELNNYAYAIPMYTIGYKPDASISNYKDGIPTPDKNNKYELIDGFYWSQYRPLRENGVGTDGKTNKEGTTIHFQYNESLRMDPDKTYGVEYVLVLCLDNRVINLRGTDKVGSTSKNTILWPSYDKLLRCGFEDAGYSIDDSGVADITTKAYRSYAYQFEVGACKITYPENTQIGFSGGGVVGSRTSPVELRISSGEKTVPFDNFLEWEGLGHNLFIQRNAFSLYRVVDPYDKTKDVLLKEDMPISAEFTVDGFKVMCSDNLFRFIKVNSLGSGTYCLKPRLLNVNRTYILDSDGIFSTKIYNTDGAAYTYNYGYKDGNGEIYFKVK